MLEFLPLFVLNMALIIGIIRWRGIFSCEGLGMAFIALVVGSDGLGLLISYLFDLLPNPDQEFHMRIFPSIVQAIGLISFAVGLYIANPHPAPIRYKLSTNDRKIFQAIGLFMVGLGTFMKLIALYRAGLLNLIDYFANMYFYQADMRGQGFEFLDTGVGLVILGMILLMVTYEHKRWRQVTLLIGMMAVAFVFTIGKGGLASSFVSLFYVLALFGQLKSWVKPKLLIPFFVLAFVGLGIKTQIKYGGGINAITYSISEIAKTATSIFAIRYSNFGMYRGYSFMINRLQEHPDMQFKGKVLKTTLTDWIPRFLWKDKQDHPFHAIGYLVNENFSVDQYANDTPTFAGSAFADYGFWSLIPYLLVGGAILGLIRRFTSPYRKNPFIFLGYIFFSVSMANAITETGFLSLFYLLVFTVAIILPTIIFIRLFVIPFVGRSYELGFRKELMAKR